MNPIIEVQNLSKLYQIGAKEAYGSLREEIMQAITAPFRRLTTHNSKLTTDSNLWALKDVSFEVNEGEVVGIIGRNGAGKSTLLKILSRITEPTSGRIVMRGRLASLLEVGTGFHPELTGRENIFLNGALLGMTNAEIRRKFDEIVAFSEIEKFLDTPVKRYSSGMYVRLAFAVAAHLEPEILVIDEVLAVGDAQFQKKCLGKMEDVAKGGRTVLFVSHNIAAVKSLCSRVIMLDAGRIAGEGDSSRVVEAYLGRIGDERTQKGIIPDDTPRTGTGAIRLRRVELLNVRGEVVSNMYLGQPFRVVLTIEAVQPVKDEVISFLFISASDGTRFALSYSITSGQSGWTLAKGVYKVRVDMNIDLLPHHNYVFDVGMYNRTGTVAYDFVEQVLAFRVAPVSEDGTDAYPWAHSHGYVRSNALWHSPEPVDIGHTDAEMLATL